jgi:hypothetical protein
VTLSGAFPLLVAVAAGDQIIYYFCTEDANVGLRRSDAGDGTDGQTFFAIVEKL